MRGLKRSPEKLDEIIAINAHLFQPKVSNLFEFILTARMKAFVQMFKPFFGNVSIDLGGG